MSKRLWLACREGPNPTRDENLEGQHPAPVGGMKADECWNKPQDCLDLEGPIGPMLGKEQVSPKSDQGDDTGHGNPKYIGK